MVSDVLRVGRGLLALHLASALPPVGKGHLPGTIRARGKHRNQALEIGPRGTRFIHYSELPQMLGVLALGIGAGLLLAGGRPSGLRPTFNRVLKRMRKLRYH